MISGVPQVYRVEIMVDSPFWKIYICSIGIRNSHTASAKKDPIISLSRWNQSRDTSPRKGS